MSLPYLSCSFRVVLSCDDVPAEPLEPAGSPIGIDMGVASFLTARVARLHGMVRRQRLDHAHKTALALVRAHDVIVHEE